MTAFAIYIHGHNKKHDGRGQRRWKQRFGGRGTKKKQHGILLRTERGPKKA